MVTVHYAFTAPANPPNTTPVLTHAQIWAGLQLKIRSGHEFLAALSACTVVADYVDPRYNNNIVVRDAVFKPEFAPAGAKDNTIREVCESFGDERIEFVQPDGTKVVNTISEGPEGELLITFSFDRLHPEIEEGDKEAYQKQKDKYRKLASGAVLSTIKKTREMVVDGRIKA